MTKASIILIFPGGGGGGGRLIMSAPCGRPCFEKCSFKNKPFIHSLTHTFTSARAEVRGTADVGAYSPFRSILLVLTHDFIITCVYGPMGSDGHKRKDADAALRTIFVPFEAKGVLYAWGPVQPANGPPTRTTSG